MRYTLRPYQVKAIETLRDKIRRGTRRLILVAPTGAGKTCMACSVIEGAVAKGSRILFLAHRRELVEQCSAKLDDIGVDHGIIKADHWRHRPELPVQVASIQTLIRRQKPSADLIVIDEAHRCGARSYLTIVESHYQDAALLGLTATPWRTDGRGLGRLYQDMVITATVAELVDQGYLIAPRFYAPHTPDLHGVRTAAGDYRADDLARAMNKSELVGDIVDHWQRLAAGRRTVVFASSVEHSQNIARSFQAAGCASEHVDGTMPEPQRAKILGRLRSGETMIVCNCDIITEGYDLPILSCAIMARPTQSSVKYLQMVGRVMRVEAGKSDALVLDHAGCVLAHGFPTDAREYSLDDACKEQKGPPLVRVCKVCFAVIPTFANCCPECGGAQPRTTVERCGPQHRDGRLRELRPDKPGPCPNCESNNTYVLRTHRLGRFTRAIKCRDCGHVAYHTNMAAAQCATMDQKREEWERIEQIRRDKGFKPGWSAHAYRRVFGVWPRGMPRDEAEAVG